MVRSKKKATMTEAQWDEWLREATLQEREKERLNDIRRAAMEPPQRTLEEAFDDLFETAYSEKHLNDGVVLRTYALRPRYFIKDESDFLSDENDDEEVTGSMFVRAQYHEEEFSLNVVRMRFNDEEVMTDVTLMEKMRLTKLKSMSHEAVRFVREYLEKHIS